jgi:hypothetical protein
VKLTDKQFMEWAESLKPCRHCSVKFVGPVCPNCEQRLLRRKLP